MSYSRGDGTIYLVVNNLRIIAQRGNFRELNNCRSEPDLMSMGIDHGASGGIGSSFDSVLRRRASGVVNDGELKEKLQNLLSTCARGRLHAIRSSD